MGRSFALSCVLCKDFGESTVMLDFDFSSGDLGLSRVDDDFSGTGGNSVPEPVRYCLGDVDTARG